ncbi:preprotein translocase subunit SecG [Blastopirellula marina]|uniref:Protein-export membrane protein SecG n=1 Tax=Blastopirellula marina TaxID=124 RepID=A0A2S8G1Q3_9BACT|nr:preprotein translocase subunit SecG [Blastopirellula marina]PQO38240.1 preprotein translocase subunit SecG [Blastopirellula marina]PTL44896.1 preprotein translocase subunit SecG [Blastopirellula marina]
MTSPILFAAASVLQYLFGPLIFLTSVFLILVVLVQRGRGGGLTGALGGAGGQSAFGAKAGDVFTKITVVVAAFWILLCILATMSLQDQGSQKLTGNGSNIPAAPVAPGDATTSTPSMTAPSTDEAAKPATETPATDEKPAADLEPAPSDVKAEVTEFPANEEKPKD